MGGEHLELFGLGREIIGLNKNDRRCEGKGQKHTHKH